MDPKQAKDGLRRTSLFLPLRWSNRQQLWQLSYGTGEYNFQFNYRLSILFRFHEIILLCLKPLPTVI